MKKKKWEKQLEHSAGIGDAAAVKNLLQQEEIQRTLEALGEFVPLESADFVQQSIQKAKQDNRKEVHYMSKKYTIAACVAAACLLCTAGAYASGVFTNKFFDDNGNFTHLVSSESLSQKEIDELLTTPSEPDTAVGSEGTKDSGAIVTTVTDEDFDTKTYSSAQQAQQATGIAPLLPSNLPEDFSSPQYQSQVLKKGGDSSSHNLDTIFAGRDGRKLVITQNVFEIPESFAAVASVPVDSSGEYTAANGTKYQSYTVDGSTTYVTTHNNQTTYIRSNGLSEQELQQILDSIA